LRIAAWPMGVTMDAGETTCINPHQPVATGMGLLWVAHSPPVPVPATSPWLFPVGTANPWNSLGPRGTFIAFCVLFTEGVWTGVLVGETNALRLWASTLFTPLTPFTVEVMGVCNYY
jgi:hypothetical protein